MEENIFKTIQQL